MTSSLNSNLQIIVSPRKLIWEICNALQNAFDEIVLALCHLAAEWRDRDVVISAIAWTASPACINREKRNQLKRPDGKLSR